MLGGVSRLGRKRDMAALIAGRKIAFAKSLLQPSL
jgi:hypothetical protein